MLLPSIIEDLGAIGHEAAGDERDRARLYRLFLDLFGSLAELADNAARYMNDLAVEISTITGDDDSFSAYKQAVFASLDEFGPPRHNRARDRLLDHRPRRPDRAGRSPGYGPGPRR